MDNIRKGIQEHKEAIKANIYKSFTNAEEVTMSDEVRAFQDDIVKGDVEVVTQDDLRETYGNKYFMKGNVDELNGRLETLIKKGEDSSISEEEFSFLEANLEATDGLILKAMAVPTAGNSQKYIPVYVSVSEEVED